MKKESKEQYQKHFLRYALLVESALLVLNKDASIDSVVQAIIEPASLIIAYCTASFDYDSRDFKSMSPKWRCEMEHAGNDLERIQSLHKLAEKYKNNDVIANDLMAFFMGDKKYNDMSVATGLPFLADYFKKREDLMAENPKQTNQPPLIFKIKDVTLNVQMEF